jgi:tetraacyldisaccharide 4'-kinase
MRLIEKVWFQQHSAKWLLLPLLFPLSLVFAIVSYARYLFFKIGVFKRFKMSVPVVIVGNIGIGGNGKTPVTLFLVEQLLAKGHKVGVISRGYGSKAPYYPYQLTEQSTAIEAGDEPLLIYQRTNVDVIIGGDRIASCRQLIAQGCEIIIADDGLQHYRLHRDYEFVVIDAKRGFGNGLLLPAGPLREGRSRLRHVDALIINGGGTEKFQELAINVPALAMNLRATQVVNVKSGARMSLDDFNCTHVQSLAKQKSINAIAGIGDPSRFFNSLSQLGFVLDNTKGFIDHQAFTAKELAFFPTDKPLLMTEKDAVKCTEFAGEHCWYLPVDAVFEEQAIANVLTNVMGLMKT